MIDLHKAATDEELNNMLKAPNVHSAPASDVMTFSYNEDGSIRLLFKSNNLDTTDTTDLIDDLYENAIYIWCGDC